MGTMGTLMTVNLSSFSGLAVGPRWGEPNCKVLGVFVPMAARLGCEPGMRHASTKGERVEGVHIDRLQKNEQIPGMGSLIHPPSLTVGCLWSKLGHLS